MSNKDPDGAMTEEASSTHEVGSSTLEADSLLLDAQEAPCEAEKVSTAYEGDNKGVADDSETPDTGKKSEEESNGDEMEALREENRKLKLELDDAKSTLAVAECVKESLIELERQKNAMSEELATMQQLLNEAHDDASAVRTSYEHQLAKTKAVVAQLENENQELRINLKLAGGSQQGQFTGGDGPVLDKETILGSAAVLTDATKSFAKRVKSNFLLDKLSSSSSSANQDPSPSQQPHSLEDGMKRAHEDTEFLKSIVVPLEEQISALKDKLRETDSLLRSNEEKHLEIYKGIEAFSQWLSGKSFDEAMSKLLQLSESKELSEGKALAQKDIYIALMASRYALLNSELSGMKREAVEVMELLDQERLTVKRLKREAVLTSTEIVKNEREHLAEITRLQAVLTDEQKDELAAKKEVPTQEQSATTGSNSTSVDSSPVESRPDSSMGTQSDDSDAANMARIVSSLEWEEMQKELAKVRSLLGVGTGDSVVGSDQYKALQAELIEVKKQKALLLKEKKEEAIFRRDLEEKWNEKAEQHRSETEELNKRLQELEGVLQNVKNSYTTTYEALRKDLQKLTKDREKIVRELKRLQEENDVLVGKHSAKAEEMQNEVISLPDKTEDMQLLLLKFREDLIKAKIAKERTEERLKGEIGLLRTQLIGEEEVKRSIEDQFTAETDSLKDKILLLQKAKSDLESQLRTRRELEEREDRAKLKQELTNTLSDKKTLEEKVSELKSKLSILQRELDNSVQVQTDFVRLSQSLQMELEKIRQSEKEVRWQHEDDVSDCQNCKAPLTVAKRKHHCRHCGRIFCSECVNKTVASGPRQRPAKVCDVCHTLLVQNSAPYFSSEVPSPHT